jgi:hypothetical protein
MKEKNKIQSSNSQLSFEFSGPVSVEKSIPVEGGRVIRLSEHVSADKPKIDYSKLILKNTKSF